ncbi:hypothetical protein [Leptobacterium sp. I13]|uniref:hypothetical protein n=1 Tax=Leptobacterium meishanense TaxID=3128904 RepID=UPI0030EDDC3F
MKLIEILLDKFKFLKTDYNFFISKKIDENLFCSIEYVNKEQNVGVSISYEVPEGYVDIFLCKLKEGKIVEDPRIIGEKTELNCFSLDDIVTLIEPSELIKPSYHYPETHRYFDEDKGNEYFISDFASCLKKHADEILRGNFSLWPKLDTIVRDRAREYGQYGKGKIG